nr:ATP-binding protein [Pseudomonadota bacterium]
MNGYQGMRWFKCDLQVQTPEDGRHWLDDDLRLRDPRRPHVDGKLDESGLQEKARRFLQRCHALELEVIGVTDHNFSDKDDPRDWFIAHLVEQSRRVAKDLGRSPLYILPGFEVDIGYHVLCLFGPAKRLDDLKQVSRVLSECGLAEGQRFENGKPRPLRFNNAYRSLKDLLECVQKHRGGIVIATHADQKDGLLSDSKNCGDYRLKGLLAIELTSNPPAQKYRDILAGRDSHWVRKGRHPAWIMSSDAKSLAVDESGRPIKNSLGCRYTWIKMSSPSVESLRQAFLDPDSRLRVPEDIANDVNPNDQQRQARICSIRIQGVEFLADQEIHFSPNMNCVIGGRGSGKSTVLEYLRVMLGKDRGADVDEETKARIERAWSTVDPSESTLEVRWRDADGVEDLIILESGRTVIAGRELIDSESFFKRLPVRFFSQQQLSRLTLPYGAPEGRRREARQLMTLLDAFSAGELASLEQREREVRREIESLFGQRREAMEMDRDWRRIRQEYEELERQWKARNDVQEEARRFQNLQAERSHVHRLRR